MGKRSLRMSEAEARARGIVPQLSAQAPACAAAAQRSAARHREEAEQCALIALARLARPEFALLIHIPNGGSRSNAYEGWRLKQAGVRAGVSDLFLPVARGEFHGLWLEFKASPPFDAPLSESQAEWLALMRGQQYAAALARGTEEAMRLLLAYLDGTCPDVFRSTQ